MKLITYHAESTGVTWFTAKNKTHITPWRMNPFDALLCYLRRDLDEIRGDERQ